MFLKIDQNTCAYSKRRQRFDLSFTSTEPFDLGAPVGTLPRPQTGVKLIGSNFSGITHDSLEVNPQIPASADSLTNLERAVINACNQEKVLYRSALSFECGYPVFEAGISINSVTVLNLGEYTEKLLTDTVKANKGYGGMVQTAVIGNMLFMSVLHFTEVYQGSTLGLAESNARKTSIDFYIIPMFPGHISGSIQTAQESSLGDLGSGYCDDVPWLPLWKFSIWYMEEGGVFGKEYNIYTSGYISVVSPVIDPRALSLLDYVEYFFKARDYIEVLWYGQYEMLNGAITLTESEAYAAFRSCINALDNDRTDALMELMDNIDTVPDVYKTMLTWLLDWFASDNSFTNVKVEVIDGECKLVDDGWHPENIARLVHHGTLRGLTTLDRPVCTRVSDLNGMVISLCRSNGHAGVTAVQKIPNKILVRHQPDKLPAVMSLKDLRAVLRECDASPHLAVLKGADKYRDSGKDLILEYINSCVTTPRGSRFNRSWSRIMTSLKEIRNAQVELSQLVSEDILNKILMRRKKK